MGLTRTKITVKSKKGKTYQRSVMVRPRVDVEKDPGRRMTAKRFAREHGATIALLGMAEGAAGHAGSYVGGKLAGRVPVKYAGTVGGLVGGHLARRHAAGALYEKNQKGVQVMHDFYASGFKTKLAFHAMRHGSAIGSQIAFRWLHNKAKRSP